MGVWQALLGARPRRLATADVFGPVAFIRSVVCEWQELSRVAAALEKDRCADGHCSDPRGVGICWDGGWSTKEGRRRGVLIFSGAALSPVVVVVLAAVAKFVSPTLAALADVTVALETVRECVAVGSTGGERNRCGDSAEEFI